MATSSERTKNDRYAPPQSRRHATGYKNPGMGQSRHTGGQAIPEAQYNSHNKSQKQGQGRITVSAAARPHALTGLKALLLTGYGKVLCQVSLFLYVATRAEPCVGQSLAKLNRRLIKGVDAHEPASKQRCSFKQQHE